MVMKQDKISNLKDKVLEVLKKSKLTKEEKLKALYRAESHFFIKKEKQD